MRPSTWLFDSTYLFWPSIESSVYIAYALRLVCLGLLVNIILACFWCPVTLILQLLRWKLPRQLLVPRRMFALIFVSYASSLSS